MRKLSKIITSTDEEFINIVKNSKTYSECLRNLGFIRVHGGNYTTLKNRIKALNIDISHFKQGHLTPIYKLEDILCEDSPYKGHIRKVILKHNLLPYKCAVCGMGPEWNNKPLTLILDHINGNHTDNRLENLRFICPHCDQQQSTYCGKNKKKYYVSEQHKKSLKTNKQVDNKRVHNNTAHKRCKKVHYCKNCGKELERNRKTGLCSICYNKLQSSKIPQKEELISLIVEGVPFIKIGRMYGVTDNSVRKWCKKYGLPFRRNDIKSLETSTCLT